MNKLALIFTAMFVNNVFASPAKEAVLDLGYAKTMAAKAAACAQKNNWKISIAIVNAEGNLVYFERGDHSYSGSIDAAIEKAKSASAFQRPTSAFTESMKNRPELATLKGVVAIQGGVPFQLNGKHAGAIGISGAKAPEDEQCALEALK